MWYCVVLYVSVVFIYFSNISCFKGWPYSIDKPVNVDASSAHSSCFLHLLPHLLFCRGHLGWSTCQWTRATPGTWPSCPPSVTSSSTPFWQPMMKWSSCMLTSQEVSRHRNLNYSPPRILPYNQHRKTSGISNFPSQVNLCLHLFILQIRDLALFTCQMTGARCIRSRWNATFTPPQGVKRTS